MYGLPESLAAKAAGREVIDSLLGGNNSPHGYLDNFFHCPFTFDIGNGDREWPTVEHAYQASKSDKADVQEYVRKASTPNEAKMMGRRLRLNVEDWDKRKARVMRNILLAKFQQHPDLMIKLLATGDALIIEGNQWHDQTWGSCDCRMHLSEPGKNWLGKLLMKVRDDTRAGL